MKHLWRCYWWGRVYSRWDYKGLCSPEVAPSCKMVPKIPVHLCLVAQPCSTLQPHGLQAAIPLSMDFPGKNTGVGCHFLLQGSCLPRDQIQVSNTGRRILYHWATWESPKSQIWSYLPKLESLVLERCSPMLRVLYAFSSPLKDETYESNSNQGVFQVVEKALFVSILMFSLKLSLLKLGHHVATHVLCFLPFTPLNFSQVDSSASPSSLLSHLFPTHHRLKGCFYRKALHGGWTWVSRLHCTLMNLYR